MQTSARDSAWSRRRAPVLALVIALASGVAFFVRDIGEEVPTKTAPLASDGPAADRRELAPSGAPELASPQVPPRLAPPARSAADSVPSGEGAARDEGSQAAPGPAARVRPLAVVLHEHGLYDVQFPGTSWVLGEGRHEAGAAFEDDTVSSVEVPAGAVLCLYDDAAGQGARVTLGAGRHNLAAYGFNDRVSAARVAREGTRIPDAPSLASASVTIHEHRERLGDLPGRVWTLKLSEGQTTRLFTAREGAFDDNAASAVWIPAGFELVLCDEPDGRGAALVLGPGFHELDRVGFNDRTSAARVTRVEGH